MGSGLLGIGLSGLAAAQRGLSTTSHNIANVNTPNYSRQEIVQTPAEAQATGGGFIGKGVEVATIRRIYNDSLQQQLQQAQADTSELQNYYSQIQQLDNLFSDSTSGLSPVLNSFFTSLQGVANNPNDTPSRQSFLSAAQTLATRFQGINDRLQQVRTDVNQQIQENVSQVNTYAKQIASLNRQVVAARGNGGGQPPNDLLDQRDNLINELNKIVGTSVVKQSDDSINVFIGNGQSIVIGSQSNDLVTVPDNADPSNLQIGVVTGGITVRFPNDVLSGGSLSGAISFRDNTLNPAQNALGRVAIGLASTFNNQHALGQDQNGQLGGAFFNVASPQVIPNANNSATGAISASISSTNSLTTSDYGVSYDGTNYSITRLSDNTTQSFATLPRTIDGVVFSVTSALTSGDSFLVQPTRTGARDFTTVINDTAKIAAAAPVRATTGSSNTGTAVASSLSVVPPAPPNASLQVPIAINFHVSGGVTTYDLVNTATSTTISSGNAYAAGSAITLNGWTLNLSGVPADNDTFTVGPNTNGVSDNRNALLLGGLQSQNLVGGTSYQGAYGQLISQVGSKTAELKVTSTAQENVLNQTQDARNNISGVNLDEEAANILRYQQAYQAAAKVISTAGVMFDAILGLFS